nr:hypothetical protein [Brucella anthropi]
MSNQIEIERDGHNSADPINSPLRATSSQRLDEILPEAAATAPAERNPKQRLKEVLMNTNTMTPAHAATFAQFLIDRNSKNDEIGNFHCALGDHGLDFPESAAALIHAVSPGATGDSELQWNIEMMAHNMRAAAEYLLMSLVEYQKNQREAA